MNPSALIVCSARCVLAAALVGACAFSLGAFGEGPSFNAVIRAGVIGGRQIVAPTNSLPQGQAPIETGDAKWTQASELTQFDFNLSESGTDVLVEIAPFDCSGFCGSSSAALLLDDLTLE